MFANEEIQQLIEEQKKVFATREDLAKMFSMVATKTELDELKQELSNLKEAVQSLTNSVDKLAKSIENLSQEYLSVGHKINRHEKWIQLLAEKLGIKLEY